METQVRAATSAVWKPNGRRRIHYQDVSGKFAKRTFSMNGRTYVSLYYEPDADEYIEHSLSGKVDEAGTLTFNIVAKGDRKRFGSGTDMFISMMNRFTQENVVINRIRGIWEVHDIDSTNRNQYFDALKNKMPPPVAARTTWTGRRAAEFGFTEVNVKQVGNEIIADFKKPLA